MNPNNDNDRNEPLSPATASPEDRESEPTETFPPFDDPASSSKAAPSPPSDDLLNRGFQSEDPIFAGHPDFSQDAAKNKIPASGVGNSERVGDVNDKTRHSDGQNSPRMPTPSPDVQKVSGSGPAIAEHSKDAKAVKSGRLPGAYVKD